MPKSYFLSRAEHAAGLRSAALYLGVLTCISASSGLGQTPGGDEILAAVAAHQLSDNRVLTHYTGLRVYTLHNSRFQVKASMTVRVEYHQAAGKSFTVLAQTGSPRVIQRVFQPLLKTEADESKPDRRGVSALNTLNYHAQVMGREYLNGNDCWVLSLEPARRSRFLLRGKLWVDVNEMQPVQLQGRPTGSVSFWVAEPLISETLGRWNGFWLPARNISISNGFLLGASELTIDYLKYDIDVRAPQRAATARAAR